MRTALGVVKIVGSTLVVKLESGLTIPLAKTSKFNFGDEVEISYDFTTKVIKTITPHTDEIEEMRVLTPPEVTDKPDEDTLIFETGELSGPRDEWEDLDDWILGCSPPED